MKHGTLPKATHAWRQWVAARIEELALATEAPAPQLSGRGCLGAEFCPRLVHPPAAPAPQVPYPSTTDPGLIRWPRLPGLP